MKFLEKISGKFVKNASVAVKSEVKQTAIDMLPKVVGFGAAILGIFIFREAISDDRPQLTATHITTNNYFLGNAGEDVIKKIIEREEY